jgi:hypothetical protein
VLHANCHLSSLPHHHHPTTTTHTPTHAYPRPAHRALAVDELTAHVPLSVDTFYASVASAAVEAGATMVNDVSGGTLDGDMFAEVCSDDELS